MKRYYSTPALLLFLCFCLAWFPVYAQDNYKLQIQWLGQSAFLITSPQGTRVLTDPYPPILGYPHRTIKADLVTISTDLFDHNYVQMATGNPRLLYGLTLEGQWTGLHTTIKDIAVSSIGMWGDPHKGEQRGKTGMFLFETGGIRILHMGNLGHPLDDKAVHKLGTIDILMLPVGGYYTINGHQAAEIVKAINPKIAIPMHYKTSALVFDLEGPNKFLSHFPHYKTAKQLTVTKASLPASTEIYLLDFKR